MLSRYRQDVASRPALTLSVALFLTSLLAYLGTPERHSLLTSTVAWGVIFGFTTLRVGSRSLIDAAPSQKLAWAAGGLLALAQVEEKAVYARGIWWAKALWPLIICTINDTGIFGDNETKTTDDHADKHGMLAQPGLTTPLYILSAAAVVATYSAVVSNTGLSVCLAYALVGALALLLVQKARGSNGQNGGTVIYSANGYLAPPEDSGQDNTISIIRDVSATALLFTAIATIMLEGLNFGGLTAKALRPVDPNEPWTFKQLALPLVHFFLPAIYIMMNGSLLLLILRQTAFTTSFIPLAATIVSQLFIEFSLSRLWFAILCGFSSWLYFDEQTVNAGVAKTRVRAIKLLIPIAALSFGLLAAFHIMFPNQAVVFGTPAERVSFGQPPKEELGPIQYDNPLVHPVDQLIRDAEGPWAAKYKGQSQTLEAAVTEYKRRYGMLPPPNFDKWYEFAKRNNVQIIDEYDTIYHSLLPFWGLKPSTIRSRVREALGFNNMLMGLLVRDGKAAHVQDGPDWLQEAAVGMMEQWVQYLPDMDLAFNIHDEPRVVVPYDQLSRLARVAIDEQIPASLASKSPKNAFSPPPSDMKYSKRVPESKTTRFNVFAHQPVWVPSRMSCPPDSPARGLDENFAKDNLTSYALTDMAFVYNHTAFSDVCNSPSFSKSFGFFDRPNAFNVVHELFPIFSQSKLSSFQDILFPSPWYWFGKVNYNEEKDMDWTSKINSLWWRGSTTGGFSRDGGWRRQHRQQIVKKLNALDKAKVYENTNKDKPDAAPEWKRTEVKRKDFEKAMDVHFSHVGQCDDGDCDAQREFFKIVEPADMQEAWKYRYLLDMDGNAFSGRFYAFLESHSLTFKFSVFREWHEEWIKPWVHYIPLSLRGEEGLELVRYMSTEEQGKAQAIKMAEASRDWAKKALRKEDFEAWFFRLLLEYGRVVDDNRDSIGFSGS